MSTEKKNLLNVNTFFFATFCLYFILSWIISGFIGIYAVVITGFLTLFLFPAIYCQKKNYKIKEIFSLKILPFKSFVLILIGAVIALFLSQIAAALGVFVYDLIGRKPLPQITLETDNLKIIFQFLLTGLFVPVMEETYFRGFLLGMYNKLNIKHAALLSGVLFGLFHLQFHIIIGTIVAGIIWAYFVTYTKSILSSIVPHILFNSTTLWIMYNQDKIKKMTGDETGKINIGAIFFLILVVGFLLYLLYAIMHTLKKWSIKEKTTNIELINEKLENKILSEDFYAPISPWLPIYIFTGVVFIFSGILIFS